MPQSTRRIRRFTWHNCFRYVVEALDQPFFSDQRIARLKASPVATIVTTCMLLALLVILTAAILAMRRADGLENGFRQYAISSLAVVSIGAIYVLGARQFIFRQIAARRRLAGQCLTCAYDLRGSSSRCPECGTPAAA